MVFNHAIQSSNKIQHFLQKKVFDLFGPFTLRLNSNDCLIKVHKIIHIQGNFEKFENYSPSHILSQYRQLTYLFVAFGSSRDVICDK
jgi:hypothetical protein